MPVRDRARTADPSVTSSEFVRAFTATLYGASTAATVVTT